MWLVMTKSPDDQLFRKTIIISALSGCCSLKFSAHIWHDMLCPSVVWSMFACRLSVVCNICIVAKRYIYILPKKNCLKMQIGLPDRYPVAFRGVARNLIWVGINCTISNLSWVKETKQPHKKFKVDWFGVYIPIYPRRYAPGPIVAQWRSG